MRGSTVRGAVTARDVYLVMGSAGRRPRPVAVALDGQPLRARDAGRDVHSGAVTVRTQRLYRLVSLPGAQSHQLTLRLAPGVSAYAFTFG